MSNDIYLVKKIGTGSFSIMAKPDISKNMDSEVTKLTSRGITKVISLLTHSEASDAGLDEEKQIFEQAGLHFYQFSITDYGVPKSLPHFSKFIQHLYDEISQGQHAVIHCYAGIGRSGVVAASLLLHCGYSVANAFEHVSIKRCANVPDTQAQKEWVSTHQAAILNPKC